MEVFLSYGALRNLAKTLGHDDDLALAFHRAKVPLGLPTKVHPVEIT